jgi:hypothetical protein
MSVWDMPEGPQNVFSRACSPGGDRVRNVYDSYLCCVNRIVLRTREQLIFVPNGLSMAKLGAIEGLGECVAQCAEAGYTRWQRFVVCASQAVARRARVDWLQPILAAPVMALCRVRAFFIAQKGNGHNAP